MTALLYAMPLDVGRYVFLVLPLFIHCLWQKTLTIHLTSLGVNSYFEEKRSP